MVARHVVVNRSDPCQSRFDSAPGHHFCISIDYKEIF